MKNSKSYSFSQTLKHFKNYLGADFAKKAAGFLTLPIITRLISPSEFGIVSVFNSYIGIFMIILSFNIYSSVSRYAFEEKNYDLNGYFSTVSVFTLIALFMSSTLFIAFKEHLSILLNLPVSIIIFFLPLIIFSLGMSFFEQIYYPKRKSKIIAIAGIVKVYSQFCLTILIVLILTKNKYMGPIIGNTIIGLIFFCFYIYKLIPYFKISFSRTHLKYALSYSLPLIPYALSGIILAQFDLMMINKYIGSNDAGLYGIAYKIGMLLAIFITALWKGFGPSYFNYMNTKNYSKLDSDLQKIYKLVLIAALFLIYFAKDIGFVVADKRYHSSIPLVPIIVIGYIFFSLFRIYGANIGYSKKTIYLSIVNLTAGITNIILNAIYIPIYGYKAGAYTTVISFALMALLAWVVTKAVLKLHTTPIINILKPTSLFLLYLAAYYILLNIRLNIFILAGIKLVFVTFFSIFLFYKYFLVINQKLSIYIRRNICAKK